MKRLFPVLLFMVLLLPGRLSAQVLTEADLVETLMRSLQQKDSRLYMDLFPGIDSMAAWVTQYADKGSEAYRRMQYLRDNYTAKLDFDSSVHAETEKGFNDFIKKGNRAGVHWDHIVFMRYELEKIRRGRGLIPEKIAPLRFLGYVFFKDILTRKTYAFTVFDIMQVNNLWYEGELANIFEATSKEEFETALAAEKKKQKLKEMGIEDTTGTAKSKGSFNEDEDAKMPEMKEVLDRKFYKGKFDNEISVQLYVRHIKGNCPEVICSWDALFRFGDQDEFVRMDVSRTADGKWLFTEDLGGMELTLDGNTYTGSYASSSDKTEYEVKLVESPVSPKKLAALDEQLETGTAAK